MDREDVLVLAPSGRDAALTGDLLARERIPARICRDARELADRMPDAAMALVAEEALTHDASDTIAAALRVQPPWSDFPIAVVSASEALTTRGGARWLQLGNVTLLERPLRITAMLMGVRAGLRARRRQYDARRAIESRDQFLAMLGHELRNPLAAVCLASDLQGRASDVAEIQRHRLVIDRHAHHLNRLVDDLLDVARVTYGKVALQLEPVDLGEVLCFTAHSVEPALAAARVAFQVKVPTGLYVLGDRVRLEQIFTNLLSNAVKYTTAGGSAELAAWVTGNTVHVSVADTGIGIAPEMVDRIFDLFTQADGTLDRSRGGLGIGLTVVRRLVALHGGEVHAESDGLGKGAVIHVTLPLLTVPSAREESTRVTSSSLPPARVVLVEDADDIREMLQELLEVGGHSVWAAADGPHGVETILQVGPDIAFVDIGLPGFDGYEVARRLRARGATVPLVALSGYGRQEDRQLAKQAGFDAHITKPVDVARFYAAMASLAPSSRQDAPLNARARGS
jgi:signal transduction histidine kinase/ActR/RegA family two-component response regulator